MHDVTFFLLNFYATARKYNNCVADNWWDQPQGRRRKEFSRSIKSNWVVEAASVDWFILNLLDDWLQFLIRFAKNWAGEATPSSNCCRYSGITEKTMTDSFKLIHNLAQACLSLLNLHYFFSRIVPGHRDRETKQQWQWIIINPVLKPCAGYVLALLNLNLGSGHWSREKQIPIRSRIKRDGILATNKWCEKTVGRHLPFFYLRKQSPKFEIIEKVFSIRLPVDKYRQQKANAANFSEPNVNNCILMKIPRAYC